MPNDNLLRPQLLGALRDAITTRRLTLVSAPAGSGKTTLLAALPHAFPELSVAWFTLDQDDNEPTTFLTALLISLQKLHPKVVSNAQTLLAGLPDPGAELRCVMGVLINDILAFEPAPFVLVLDDLHSITHSAILDALDYLLEHLPPVFHLAVTCRRDPPLALARLRSRGQLAEFRLPDLRFSASEVSALLNGQLHLNLSNDEVQTLQKHTEGWVAGLWLFTLSLKPDDTTSERTTFIARLAQTNRYVFDLLVEEVLQRQPPDIRTFLLETSILPELTPALCLAVTNRPNAPALLEDVYRRNLFLVAVSNSDAAGQTTYRYHALFAEFLGHHLMREDPDKITELHRRAAAAQTIPARAIHHYLAAKRWAEAVPMIEELARQQMQQGFVRQQLVGWAQTLPETMRQERPWLKLLLGAYDFQSGQRQAVAPLLLQALEAFEANSLKEGKMLALLYLVQMDDLNAHKKIAPQLKEMLLTQPQLASPLRLALVHIGMAWASLYRNEWPEAEENLGTALEITRRSADVGAYQLMAQSIGPQYLFTDGGISPIERYCDHVMARFGQGDGLIQGGTYSLLSCIYFYQGKLDKAREIGLRAQQISRTLGGFAYLDMLIDNTLLFDFVARAEYNQLEQYLTEVWPRLQQVDTYQAVQSGYYYVWGRALLMQNRLEEARQIAPRTESRFQYYAGDESYQRAALLAGFIALHEQRYTDGEEQFRRAANWQQLTRHTVLATDARLGLARLYLEWNRPDEALAELKTALAEWKRRSMPGVLLQEGRGIIPLLEFAVAQNIHSTFADHVLTLFGVEQTVSVSSNDAAKLSPRECEVLQLVAEGLTNREIAAKLVITPGTVKRHTINIYNKLGVHNRTQAVTRAREWNLL